MARQRRWMLIAVGLPLYTVALMLIVTVTAALLLDPARALELPLDGFDPSEPLWWSWVGAPVLLIVASQAVFVIPLVRMPIQAQPSGRSVVASVVAASTVAAALGIGVLCGLLELFDFWSRFTHDADAYWAWPVTLPVFLVSWVFWSGLLLAFTRRKRDRSLPGRLAAWLLAGTVVEILATLPIDVMVRRRTDCYCATGTFHALLIATFASMWLAGPGVVILYMRRRRRLAAHRCDRCGYTKGPAPSPTCPECGYEW